MALYINDECISCGACVSECPNTAIFDAGENWTMADGTSLDDNEEHDPISEDHTFIVAAKCTECNGFFDEPQCVDVCPTDAIHPDPNNEESKEELLAKKAKLHGE